MTAIARFVERVINRRTRHYIAKHPRFTSAAVTTRRSKP